jgi:hypothetical protein
MYRFPMPTPQQWRAVAAAFLTKIILINNKKKMLTMLGWFLASTLKPYLAKHDIQLGILNVYGSKESGKTSSTLMFLRFFGYMLARGISTSKTFTVMKKLSMYNSQPVWYDEYRESKREAPQIKELIRSTYDGAVEYRGQGDLSSEAFVLVAPFIISGEDRPDDPATNDRLCPVNLKPHEKQEQPYLELERMQGKEYFILGYIQWLLEKWDRLDALRVQAQEEVQKLRAFESIRAEKTGVCVLFGLLIGLELQQHLGIEPSYAFDEALNTIKELAVSIQKKRPQDMLIAMMIELREHCTDILRDGQYDIRKEKDGTLVGYFKQSTILKHMARSIRGGISEESLRNRIRENIETGGFILSESRQTSIGGRNVRCLVVNLTKLCEQYPEEFQLSDWQTLIPLNVSINDSSADR